MTSRVRVSYFVVLWVSGIFGSLANTPENKDLLYYNAHEKHNFIIRWQYQHFCDHVFDPRRDIWRWPTDQEKGVTFNPDKVKPGDTICVRMIPYFFEEMHPRIKHPYIIVTAGECLDRMRTDYKEYLDEYNVIAWFGVHANAMAMKHPKFHAIPIGILQHPDNYKKRAQLDNYFTQLRTTTKKRWLVYMNFACQDTKPERQRLCAFFKDKPFCKKGHKMEFDDYLKQMAQSYFTLSPHGLGPDCYRTWEALLAGSIPIVRSSFLDPLYEGLPVLIVDRWQDITEPFLWDAYTRITQKKYDISHLYTDFWTNKIKKLQQEFRAEWYEENE